MATNQEHHARVDRMTTIFLRSRERKRYEQLATKARNDPTWTKWQQGHWTLTPEAKDFLTQAAVHHDFLHPKLTPRQKLQAILSKRHRTSQPHH